MVSDEVALVGNGYIDGGAGSQLGIRGAMHSVSIYRED
jgi:hypothetical protein